MDNKKKIILFVLLTAILLLINVGLINSILNAYFRDDVDRLLNTNECESCDLIGLVLKDAKLSGAKLINSNLSGADLRGADLSRADLSNTLLLPHNGYSVNLSGANLSGTNFTNAKMHGLVLLGAKVDNSTRGLDWIKEKNSIYKINSNNIIEMKIP